MSGCCTCCSVHARVFCVCVCEVCVCAYICVCACPQFDVVKQDPLYGAVLVQCLLERTESVCSLLVHCLQERTKSVCSLLVQCLQERTESVCLKKKGTRNRQADWPMQE